MANIIKRLRIGVLWSKAIGEFRAHNTKAARDLIERIDRISPLEPYQQAYLAQIYIFEGDRENARPYLVSALEATEHSSSENDKYVNCYASVMLKLMNENGPVDDLIGLSKSIKCKESLRRWLPLSVDDAAFSVRRLLGKK